VKYRDSFHNKIKFNQLFKEFIGREYIVIPQSTDHEIRSFLCKHDWVMLKAASSSSGKQIKKINTSAPDIMREIESGKYDLIEEVAINHKDIAKLNPTSLNTIRIVTVHSEKSFNIIFTGIRIGAKGAYLDNVSQGGCCAAVDTATGKIKSVFTAKATCETIGTQSYRNEIGYQLPYWNETLEMIKEASKIVPQIHIVGWDVAITPDGPILIEGNESFGPSIMQYYASLNEGGVKKEMLAAINNI
jgi:hypothetical protein